MCGMQLADANASSSQLETDMHDKALSFAIMLAMIAGCLQSQPGRSSETQLTTGGVARGGSAAPREDAPPDPLDSQLPCSDDQAAARALLTDAQSCTQDDDCIVASIDAPCLLPFLCPTWLSRTADLERVRREAAQLSAAFRACSDACAIASCVLSDASKLFCDPTTRRCALRTPAR